MKKNKHLKELKLVFPSNSKKLKHCNLNLFFDGDELGQFSACLGVLYPELFSLKLDQIVSLCFLYPEMVIIRLDQIACLHFPYPGLVSRRLDQIAC